MFILNAEEEAMIRAMRQNRISPVTLTKTALSRMKIMKQEKSDDARVDDVYIRLKSVEEETCKSFEACKILADHFKEMADTGK